MIRHRDPERCALWWLPSCQFSLDYFSVCLLVNHGRRRRREKTGRRRQMIMNIISSIWWWTLITVQSVVDGYHERAVTLLELLESFFVSLSPNEYQESTTVAESLLLKTSSNLCCTPFTVWSPVQLRFAIHSSKKKLRERERENDGRLFYGSIEEQQHQPLPPSFITILILMKQKS